MKCIVATLLIGLGLLSVVNLACGSRPEVQPPAVTQKEGAATTAKAIWEREWEQTLKAAREEGKVSFYSGYNQNFRVAFAEALAKKYSITMDPVIGSTEDITSRLLTENRAGIYYADVTSLSTTTMIRYPEGILQPLDRLLILPEVTDPKAWWGGQLTWLDPDKKTMLAWRDTVTPSIVINTEMVKPEEIKSWNDVLNPKLKGKILVQDPTTGGGGQRVMGMLIYKIMNKDFVQALVKQEPELQKDNRLLVEWVARGKYPILLGPRKEEVFQFLQAGAPIAYITPSEGTYTSVGDGAVAMPRSSTHPNAVKVFLNFFLSSEGQTIAAQTMGQHSLRVDVPTSFLDPATVRQPGVRYISTLEKEYRDRETALAEEVSTIFRGYLKK
ncbi:MAG: extracellular solute-binding protein [Chloroflexi bacterium]|nr:extracellular solute-binding protein [Chloroflexota bacterium]